MNDLKFTTAGDYMEKPPMLERFAAQSLVDHGGELIFSKERFAELIVQECCDVLQNEDIRYSGYGYNQGLLQKKIKEHFGVDGA